MIKSFDALILVQARVESTRLPGKVLLPFGGKTLVQFLLDRLLGMNIGPVIATISDSPLSLPLYNDLMEKRYNVFPGDPKNVFHRFLQASKNIHAKTLVRVTSDNPLTDTRAIKGAVQMLIDHDLDYAWIEGVPVGMGCDVFKMSAFQSFQGVNLTQEEEEHIVYAFRNNPSFQGRAYHTHYPEGSRELNFTIDTLEEYSRVFGQYMKFIEKNKTFDEESFILSQLSNNKEL